MDPSAPRPEAELPRFEAGRFLQARELNALADAVRALTLRVHELERRLAALETPVPSAGRLIFRPTSLVLLPGSQQPPYPYSVTRETGEDCTAACTVRSGNEAVLRVDPANRTLLPLAAAAAPVPLQVRLGVGEPVTVEVSVRGFARNRWDIVAVVADDAGVVRLWPPTPAAGTYPGMCSVYDSTHIQYLPPIGPATRRLEGALPGGQPRQLLLLVECRTEAGQLDAEVRDARDQPLCSERFRIQARPQDQRAGYFQEVLLVWEGDAHRISVSGGRILGVGRLRGLPS
jgi:hypothetical protein